MNHRLKVTAATTPYIIIMCIVTYIIYMYIYVTNSAEQSVTKKLGTNTVYLNQNSKLKKHLHLLANHFKVNLSLFLIYYHDEKVRYLNLNILQKQKL